MKIKTELNPDHCERLASDPARLAALEKSGQMTSPHEEAFDRLTNLAARLLKVPLTFVSFVDENSQYLKSFHGLPEPFCSDPRTPIDVSICQYTLAGDVICLDDIHRQPQLVGNPLLEALGLRAYLGIPLRTSDDQILGSFCAASYEPKAWSDEDIDIMKDLAQSMMSEVQLRMSLDKIEAEQSDWNKTVTLLAHDIRSPLVTAHGFASLAEQNIADSDLVLNSLSAIQRSTKKAMDLIENILDWKLVRLGRNIELEKSKVKLSEILSPIIEDIKSLNKVEIEDNFDSQKIELRIHKSSVVRAVENLMNNAIKYGDLSKPISLNIEQVDEHVEIKVHNYGNPLEEKDISQIFEDGRRSSGAQDGNSKGWGFGLTLVSAVAESHKGDIQVKSNQSEGTTFILSLPITKATQQQKSL